MVVPYKGNGWWVRQQQGGCWHQSGLLHQFVRGDGAKGANCTGIPAPNSAQRIRTQWCCVSLGLRNSVPPSRRCCGRTDRQAYFGRWVCSLSHRCTAVEARPAGGLIPLFQLAPKASAGAFGAHAAGKACFPNWPVCTAVRFQRHSTLECCNPKESNVTCTAFHPPF